MQNDGSYSSIVSVFCPIHPCYRWICSSLSDHSTLFPFILSTLPVALSQKNLITLREILPSHCFWWFNLCSLIRHKEVVVGVGNYSDDHTSFYRRKSLAFSLVNKCWSSGAGKDLRGQVICLHTLGKFCIENLSPKHNHLVFSLTFS